MINKQSKSVETSNDAQLFDRIQSAQCRFDELCQRVEAAYSGVAQAAGLAEIQAVVDDDRREQRRQRYQ